MKQYEDLSGKVKETSKGSKPDHAEGPDEEKMDRFRRGRRNRYHFRIVLSRAASLPILMTGTFGPGPFRSFETK
jgi:hypothetical protein